MGTDNQIRIAIAGASGRMGRMLIEGVLGSSDLQLVGALERTASPLLGQDAGGFLGKTTGVLISDRLPDALSPAQVLIDFTMPEATLAHLAWCAEHRTACVIGTTGFDEAGKRAIAQAAQCTPVVFSPNMSIGVNATFKVIELAARLLDEGYDIEIFEAHHKHKIDAPSGTALRMGEVIAGVKGKPLADLAIYERQGTTGPRPEGKIGFSVLRAGDIVGDHTVSFSGAGERIEITHRSSSRANYAAGSLRAARFLAGQKPGLYDMQAVLGF